MSLYRQLQGEFIKTTRRAPFQGFSFQAVRGLAPVWMALFAILTGIK
jgi:hypothetical protein